MYVYKIIYEVASKLTKYKEGIISSNLLTLIIALTHASHANTWVNHEPNIFSII
jgi:hypothetical protein